MGVLVDIAVSTLVFSFHSLDVIPQHAKEIEHFFQLKSSSHSVTTIY